MNNTNNPQRLDFSIRVENLTQKNAVVYFLKGLTGLDYFSSEQIGVNDVRDFPFIRIDINGQHVTSHRFAQVANFYFHELDKVADYYNNNFINVTIENFGCGDIIIKENCVVFGGYGEVSYKKVQELYNKCVELKRIEK